MKKIIALVCSLVLALFLTACNGSKMEDDISSVVSSAEDIVSDTMTSMENAISSGMASVESGVESATGADITSESAKITADEATTKALEHAGLNKESVTDLKVDLDRDDGVLKYDVDFKSGGTEYDYDINAQTGEVISVDKDND